MGEETGKKSEARDDTSRSPVQAVNVLQKSWERGGGGWASSPRRGFLRLIFAVVKAWGSKSRDVAGSSDRKGES